MTSSVTDGVARVYATGAVTGSSSFSISSEEDAGEVELEAGKRAPRALKPPRAATTLKGAPARKAAPGKATRGSAEPIREPARTKTAVGAGKGRRAGKRYGFEEDD